MASSANIEGRKLRLNNKLRTVLSQIHIHGPIKDSTAKMNGVSRQDTPLLKNLGLIKRTKNGWIITKKGIDVLNDQTK